MLTCSEEKCQGENCKYDCYSDGFNFYSLASKPCDCNYTKVYDGMCYTPYNDCDNFIADILILITIMELIVFVIILDAPLCNMNG